VESNRDCQPVTADDVVRHYVTPSEIYTGFNGRDLYQAALQANYGDLEVSAATGLICAGLYGCVGPNEDGIVALVTARAPGQSYVTVTSGNVVAYVNVQVANYSTAQYDLGDQRYNNPANANASDRVACISCHASEGAAPHTPLALAGKSDEVLLSSILQSKYPDICENDDGACDCAPVNDSCACTEADCRVNEGYTLSLEGFGGGVGDHVFNLTPEEEDSIMAYIRAIPLDFDY
jgi:hypothetical protein